jgi:uncharacterized protein (TIGR00290 family)
MNIIVSQSSGKDSALALHNVLKDPVYNVISLHTTFDKELHRVGMHGVREELVISQAESLGIPLDKIYIKKGITNNNYEKALLSYYKEQKQSGVDGVVFGDIFLEDLKNYRINLLRKAGLKAIFPLWGKSTLELSGDLIKLGFKIKLCSLNSKFFNESDLELDFDFDFLKRLPDEVDPCGENGEFHTFVYDGPTFSKPVTFIKGEKVLRTYEIKTEDGDSQTSGFWFIDLLPC